VPDLYRVVLPFIGIFVVSLLITTYVPQLTLFMVPPSEEVAAIEPQTNDTTPAPTENAQPTVPVGNCEEQGPDESFEQFDQRCNITGAFPNAPGAAGGAAPAAPAAPQGNCEEQGPDESFDAFDRRCNITGTYPPGGAAPPAADAPISAGRSASSPSSRASTR
jgi:hypothetical protein